MTNKEELIKELEVYMKNLHWNWSSHAIADFIIADRKRICEPITNLKPHHNLYTAVKEVLKLSGLEQGE